MKIYKLTIHESVGGVPGITVLTEHYKNREDAQKKKTETLEGLKALLGSYGHYHVEIQEIDVKE